MGNAPLVYPVVMCQRQADIAKQQNVIRYPGVTRRQRVHIHLLCHCPRRYERFQLDVLDFLRHSVGSTNMVHQILWRTLPDGTPRHRAPPQLSQIQVAACHMPVHIAPDHGAAKLTRRRLFLPVLHPGRLFHLLQLWLSPPHVRNHRRRPSARQLRQLRY